MSYYYFMLEDTLSVSMNKDFFKWSKVKSDNYLENPINNYNVVWMSFENIFHDVSNNMNL
jgi:hypothetical protein